MKHLIEIAKSLCLGGTGPIESVMVSCVLDSMSDSLIVIGTQGDVLYANKATWDILGLSLHDFREKGLEALISENHENHDFKEILADVVWKKCTSNYREFSYRHPSGNVKRLAATITYLVAQTQCESVLIGFVLVFKDITEVFKLRAREQDLLREKQRADHDKARSLQRLAMAVAHEIRNPVVTIGGFASRLMRDPNSSTEARRQAETIFQDARKLEKLVDLVQQYCDLPELNATEGDISLTVKSAVEEMLPRARAKNITLDVQENMAGRRCVFDRVLIKRALVELLKNAIDFSHEGSTVRVSIGGNDEETVLEVTDSGVGIEPQNLEYLFDPFFSTRPEASGMGLAIVDRVVHEHMGRIDVDSTPGRGTTVRIVLYSCFLFKLTEGPADP